MIEQRFSMLTLFSVALFIVQLFYCINTKITKCSRNALEINIIDLINKIKETFEEQRQLAHLDNLGTLSVN